MLIDNVLGVYLTNNTNDRITDLLTKSEQINTSERTSISGVAGDLMGLVASLSAGNYPETAKLLKIVSGAVKCDMKTIVDSSEKATRLFSDVVIPKTSRSISKFNDVTQAVNMSFKEVPIQISDNARESYLSGLILNMADAIELLDESYHGDESLVLLMKIINTL